MKQDSSQLIRINWMTKRPRKLFADTLSAIDPLLAVMKCRSRGLVVCFITNTTFMTLWYMMPLTKSKSDVQHEGTEWWGWVEIKWDGKSPYGISPCHSLICQSFDIDTKGVISHAVSIPASQTKFLHCSWSQRKCSERKKGRFYLRAIHFIYLFSYYVTML